MVPALKISTAYWETMQRHVAAVAPLEACGLLAGITGEVAAVFAVTNILASVMRFRMDPREQLEAFERIQAAGLELVAIYHSHPDGPGLPSPTDIAESGYPVVNIIWTRSAGLWQARGFWIHAGGFSEALLHVAVHQ